MHPITLRFERDLEAAFRRSYFDSNLRYLRVALVLAIVLYVSFSVLDYVALPEHMATLTSLRFGIVIPTLILTLVASYTRFRRAALEPMIFFSVLFAGWTLVAIWLSVPESLEKDYAYGILPLIICTYTFVRQRFVQATLNGVLIMAAVEPALLYLKMDTYELVVLNFYLVCLNILGMAAAYAIESFARTTFLQSRLHIQSKEALEAEVERRRKTATKLLQASQRAEAASRAKSEFLAKMSHEIRTPMNGVLGMTELLLSTELNEPQREFAQTVQGSGQALLQIINDILDFSKIEANKLRLQPKPMDLRRVINEVIQLLATQADKNSLELRVSVPADLPKWVMGDTGRVRQILINLVGNGIKYTAEGWVLISVELQDNDRVRFEVHDSGPGLTEDQRARLFTPFEQLDAQGVGGTGLGLAICRQLVLLMKGDIGVDSEPGVGSTFWLSIPLPVAEPPDRRESAPPRRLQILKTGAAPRILVAEDNRVNQAVVRGMLKNLGCDVVLADDGQAAVEAAAGGSLDIILMDLRMPVMDGLQATHAIRNLGGRLQEIPIVALTADAQEEDRTRCLNAGMSEYLSKPVQSDDLRRMLLRCLAPGDGRQATSVRTM